LGQARPRKSARAPLSPSPPTAVGRSPDSLAAQYSPTGPLLSRSLTAGPTLSSPTSGVPNPDSTTPPPSLPWTRLPRRGPHAKRCPVLFKPRPPLGRNRALAAPPLHRRRAARHRQCPLPRFVELVDSRSKARPPGAPGSRAAPSSPPRVAGVPHEAPPPLADRAGTLGVRRRPV
jgi:hypothetical protein